MQKRTVDTNLYHVEPESFPEETIPRPIELDERDPFWAALAVGEFIGAPQTIGHWATGRFEIDRERAVVDYMRAHGEDSPGRWTAGLGHFISLYRTDEEDDMGRRKLWMSNTPQEVIDHRHALENASGRVLVSGLGLSVVVSGLLANPDVESISVVELEPDIIKLVGPAYEDEPRVSIYQGDIMTWEFSRGAHWDYAWHDIWATISDKNLNPEEAENGISYDMVFDRFAPYVDMQDAWAVDMAHQLAADAREAERMQAEFEKKWADATFEERADMLIDHAVDTMFHVPGITEKIDRDQRIWLMEQTNELEAVFNIAADDKAPVLY